MSQVYFSSDFHLGHKVIVQKYRNEFSSIKEHDDHIFNELNKLHKRDVIYLLGDILFDCDKFEEYIERFREVKARMKLVMGNHDSLKLYKYQDVFEIQLPLFSFKNSWVSHVPINDSQFRGRNRCIHGHLHKYSLDSKYVNVNLDVNGYKFLKWEDIRDKELL